MNPHGNPNHDPKTGQFSSGPGGAGSHVNGGAHSEHRTLGTRVIHGAKIAAKVAALGALAAGGILLAHGISEKVDSEHLKNFTKVVRDRYLKQLGEAAASTVSSGPSMEDRIKFEEEQLKRTQEENANNPYYNKVKKAKTRSATGPKIPRTPKVTSSPRSRSRKK